MLVSPICKGKLWELVDYLTLRYTGVGHNGPPLAILATVTQGLTFEWSQLVTIPISTYICMIFCLPSIKWPRKMFRVSILSQGSFWIEL